jgi:hypothetical protein
VLKMPRPTVAADTFAHLLLQKQITLDEEPEQLLHTVVVGSQWDALLLEEHEFVVGQAAADSISGGILQENDVLKLEAWQPLAGGRRRRTTGCRSHTIPHPGGMSANTG